VTQNWLLSLPSSIEMLLTGAVGSDNTHKTPKSRSNHKNNNKYINNAQIFSHNLFFSKISNCQRREGQCSLKFLIRSVNFSKTVINDVRVLKFEFGFKHFMKMKNMADIIQIQKTSSRKWLSIWCLTASHY